MSPSVTPPDAPPPRVTPSDSESSGITPTSGITRSERGRQSGGKDGDHDGDHDSDEDDGLDTPDEGGATVGDLVVVPVPRVRLQIGCGERVGLVVEDRRNVVKVFFAEIERTFWVDRNSVLPIPQGRLPAAPLTLRLHQICRDLHAAAVEIYDREGDADAFHIFTRGTNLDALERVRAFLGADFRRLAVDPGGVRRARLTLVFRTATNLA